MAVVSYEDFQSRVNRGAALLDAEFPGWFERIDTDSLDIATCSRCVLGQVYGDYLMGVLKVLPSEDTDDAYWNRVAEYGFTLRDDDADINDAPDSVVERKSWFVLRRAWLALIRKLQSKS